MTARWKAFWFAETPPHVFAAFRIAVALAGCLTMVGLVDVPMLLSVGGLAPSPGGGLGIRSAIQQAGLDRAVGWLLWGLNALAFVLLAIGLRTPVASFMAFAGTTLLLWWNPLPFSAGQHLLHMLTFYVLLTNCGLVWSVDAWMAAKRGVSWENELQPIWPLRLAQYQIALMYLAAALWKLYSVAWRDGTALHYVLSFNTFQRVPVQVPPAAEPVLAGLTYLTLIWELLFLPALITRRTRIFALAVGIGMHLGMWVLMDIGTFTPTVLAAYVTFADPERVRRLAAGRRLPLHAPATAS
jgi:HTTM domain